MIFCARVCGPLAGENSSEDMVVGSLFIEVVEKGFFAVVPAQAGAQKNPFSVLIPRPPSSPRRRGPRNLAEFWIPAS